MVSAFGVPIGEAADPLILSIDVGSSSARAIVYDAQARQVDGLEAHRPYHMRTDQSGAVEVDAAALATLVSQCIDDLLHAVNSAHRSVRAVAADTFWHSLVAVDESGNAITPVYTWADTRSRTAVADLRDRFDEHRVHERTGAVFHSSYWPAKIAWLRSEQPDLVRRTRYWMSFAEYLYQTFFRCRSVSLSMASGTGLFDQHRCIWDAELLNGLEIAETQLSSAADFVQALSGLSPPYDTRWPGLRTVPWYLPLGDGACNNVGSGAVDSSRAVVMVGTSGAMRVVRDADRFEIPPGLWTYRVDRGRIVQGGALSEGGNVFGWLMETLSHPPIPNLEEELVTLGPDAHGLTFLPFFAGERSPHWRSDMRATIHGMTFDTTVPELVRAALEAIALRFALIYDLLRREAPEAAQMIGSGVGLLHSPAWMQIMSDVLDRPVVPCVVPEATSRGAALLALEALHAVGTASDIPTPFGDAVTPNARNGPIYRAALARQEELYRRLSNFDVVPGVHQARRHTNPGGTARLP